MFDMFKKNSLNEEIKELTNQNTADSIYFLRIGNISGFQLNDPAIQGYQSIKTTGMNLTEFAQGFEIERVNGLLEFILPDNYTYLHGLCFMRLHQPAANTAKNFYNQARFFYGEDYATNAVLETCINYGVDSGREVGFQFYQNGTTYNNINTKKKVAIEENIYNQVEGNIATYDYLTLMLRVGQHKF